MRPVTQGGSRFTRFHVESTQKNPRRVCLSWKEINNAKIKAAVTENFGEKKMSLGNPGSSWKSNAPHNGPEEKCAECPCIV